MAVDLAEGRRTEIDAMCVEVARLGREHGVATPVNDVVGELVRALEATAGGAARPGPEAAASA
jgi:2-dehydropantoate 2-reductase